MSFTNKKRQKKAWSLALLSVLIAVGIVLVRGASVSAATLTVETTSDLTAIDGNCTLREAITNVNNQADTNADCAGVGAYGTSDTINFNISGTADFTNDGQNGYRISPDAELPALEQTVLIDGYSQPNSAVNTNASPNPINARLLIELDGSAIGVNAVGLTPRAQGTTIRGLIINDWTFDGISIEADNVVIQGNFIGTNPQGDGPEPNIFRGIAGWGGPGDNALIGGTAPEMRNIISGNGTDPSGAGIGIGNNHDGWTLQGNYIGIAADGVSSVPNAPVGGSGNPSVDFVTGTLIGGTIAGAANVISGNNGHGIAPYQAPNTVIQGNFIGTDYTGTVAVGNLGGGIVITDGCDGSLIGGSGAAARNIIADSGNDGIYVADDVDVSIQGNHIGTGIVGTENLGNNQVGVSVANGATEVLIGGDSIDEGNIIANNDIGVVVSSATSQATILLNSIFDNDQVGIDLGYNGVTANDSGDPDTGPNDYLNFPQYTLVVEGGGNTEVAYRLDVPAGDYKIEFFSNNAADPSGNGEGQEYLGFQTVTSLGVGSQSFTHTLSGITGVTNLSMTATQMGLTTASGYGPTSEFSEAEAAQPEATDVSLTKTLLNPEDVAPGATLTYQFELTNNGIDAFNLAIFDGSTTGVNNIAVDALPPDMLFDASGPGDVTCNGLGANSAGAFGAILSSHSDHEAVLCGFTGPDRLLAGGDTETFTFDVVVQPDTDFEFTNIAWTPPVPTDDPDQLQFALAYGSGGDMIDYLGTSVNNVAYATYPIPVEPEPQTNTNNSNNAATTNDSLLSQTGDVLTSMPFIVAFTIASAGFLYVKNRRQVYRLR